MREEVIRAKGPKVLSSGSRSWRFPRLGLGSGTGLVEMRGTRARRVVRRVNFIVVVEN